LEHGLVQIFLSGVYILISVIVAATEGGSIVSHYSHLFGGLAGLLVGFCVLTNLYIEDWEKKLKMISMASFVILMLSGGVYFYTFKSFK
jgi:membrane associated rhomboid family serine protease